MKKVIASMVAVAGLAAMANAQVHTLLKYEVSLDGTNWASSVDAQPGDTVQVRAKAIYTGTVPVIGLSQIIFQPVVSSWQGPGFTGNGAAGDNVIVQTQGAISQTIGPFGGSRTTPLGTVADAPGVYGRLSPWGAAANSSTSYYRGFVGTGANAGLMRISQAHISNWIGTGATSGSNTINNVSGRGGINASQINQAGRNATDPAYNADSDVVVFKFGVVLSSDTSVRTLNVDTPQGAIGRRLVGGLPAEQDVLWFTGPGVADVIRGGAETMGGFINIVPSPASLALLGLGGVAILRRRR